MLVKLGATTVRLYLQLPIDDITRGGIPLAKARQLIRKARDLTEPKPTVWPLLHDSEPAAAHYPWITA